MGNLTEGKSGDLDIKIRYQGEQTKKSGLGVENIKDISKHNSKISEISKISKIRKIKTLKSK